jgi:hypothetical protein
VNPTPDSTLNDPQQVIADLRRELAERTAERDEALQQQAASTDVLAVINSSPGDLAPVFDAMLERATELCDATYGQLAVYDGEFFRFVVRHHAAPFVLQRPTRPLRPADGVTWPRLVDGEPIVHIPDVADTDLYRNGHEAARAFVDIRGGRTLLTVALRKDDLLLGALTIYRPAGPAVFRQAYRAVAELCRTGGDRDGKRSASHRDPRSIGAADSDFGGPRRD